MGIQSTSERLIRANSSLARVKLTTRNPHESHLIDIFFIDKSAMQTIITYKYMVDAADAFASFTGLFPDKLDWFKVKKFGLISNEMTCAQREPSRHSI
ncbi:MAG: hypothetical protein IM613_12985 [Cytophagales bacterium]|nr:hypothetical protein [Cytophagales bacterium]